MCLGTTQLQFKQDSGGENTLLRLLMARNQRTWVSGTYLNREEPGVSHLVFINNSFLFLKTDISRVIPRCCILICLVLPKFTKLIFLICISISSTRDTVNAGSQIKANKTESCVALA